jgi:hypothetical protein
VPEIKYAVVGEIVPPFVVVNEIVFVTPTVSLEISLAEMVVLKTTPAVAVGGVVTAKLFTLPLLKGRTRGAATGPAGGHQAGRSLTDREMSVVALPSGAACHQPGKTSALATASIACAALAIGSGVNSGDKNIHTEIMVENQCK